MGYFDGVNKGVHRGPALNLDKKDTIVNRGRHEGAIWMGM